MLVRAPRVNGREKDDDVNDRPNGEKSVERESGSVGLGAEECRQASQTKLHADDRTGFREVSRTRQLDRYYRYRATCFQLRRGIRASSARSSPSADQPPIPFPEVPARVLGCGCRGTPLSFLLYPRRTRVLHLDAST